MNGMSVLEIVTAGVGIFAVLAIVAVTGRPTDPDDDTDPDD